jgi:uncharacterized protein YodC (DUF2158 family)
MEKKFTIGNVVRLKSGGPKMTVNGYYSFDGEDSDTDVVCTWFEKGKVQEATFHQDLLKLLDNDGNVEIGSMYARV